MFTGGELIDVTSADAIKGISATVAIVAASIAAFLHLARLYRRAKADLEAEYRVRRPWWQPLAAPARALARWAARYGLIFVSACASGVWLTVVALHDKDGFIGQTAAAWVQAIGSVLAIVVSALLAIGIDRQSARRAEKQREEDRQKRTEARVMAIEYALSNMKKFRGEIAALDLRRIFHHFQDDLLPAGDVLEAYLLDVNDVDPEVVAQTIWTLKYYKLARDQIIAVGDIRNESARRKVLEIADIAISQLTVIVAAAQRTEEELNEAIAHAASASS